MTTVHSMNSGSERGLAKRAALLAAVKGSTGSCAKLPKMPKPFGISFAGVRVRLETTYCSVGVCRWAGS
jgi:hypothetical protein